MPSSGKVLTGGVDANALQRPKRFFGAARNVEEGGSLTIIGTALIDTGSEDGRGDLRGVQGHRQLRDPPRPPHGREARLPVDPDQQERHAPRGAAAQAEILQKTWILRKLLYNMDEIEAMEFILEKMKQSKNNLDFFDMMRRGADRRRSVYPRFSRVGKCAEPVGVAPERAAREAPMKEGIHPSYREVCFVDLSNGFKFVTRSA